MCWSHRIYVNIYSSETENMHTAQEYRIILTASYILKILPDTKGYQKIYSEKNELLKTFSAIEVDLKIHPQIKGKWTCILGPEVCLLKSFQEFCSWKYISFVNK